MIYVTVDEFIDIVREAIKQSDFVHLDSQLHHPEDLWGIVETVGLTVKTTLEFAPVERKSNVVD